MLFDFGGTLDADGVAWKERAFRLYREEGVSVSRDVFDPIFHRADDALVGSLPPGCSLWETLMRLFRGIGDALGPGARRTDERLAERFLADMRRHTAASAEVLARLHPRYRLGLVSNFYGNLASVCDDVALAPFFAVIIDSTRVGCVKPDPRIFHAALTGLGLGPGEAVFVGDSLPRDMAGARAVGMPHIWLRGGQAPSSAPCCAGDPVIRSLDELDEVLT